MALQHRHHPCPQFHSWPQEPKATLRECCDQFSPGLRANHKRARSKMAASPIQSFCSEVSLQPWAVREREQRSLPQSLLPKESQASSWGRLVLLCKPAFLSASPLYANVDKDSLGASCTTLSWEVADNLVFHDERHKSNELSHPSLPRLPTAPMTITNRKNRCGPHWEPSS